MKLFGLRIVRLLAAMAAVAGLMVGGLATAATPAGQVISNVALISYTLGQLAVTVSSNTVSFAVPELVDARLNWNDAGPVVVGSPDSERALGFRLRNLGNAAHTFVLTATPSANQPVLPVLVSKPLYIETGWAEGLQLSGPNSDRPAANGSSIVLEPQASAIIYVVANIPAGASQGARGAVLLEAKSATPALLGKPAGTILPAEGAGGLDLVIGQFAGATQDTGQFSVDGAVVSTAKKVVEVVDPNGGAKVVSGSLVVYEISVTAQGRGRLTDLTITDPLPAEMAYVAGSLSVNGIAVADNSGVTSVAGNTVMASLGSRDAPFVATLRLKARIR